MLSTTPTPAAVASAAPNSRAFVYVSAANTIMPGVPARYLASKREAEAEIERRCAGSAVHPVILRPGLMYNAHIRPLSTLPAFALSLTAGLHDRLQPSLGEPPFKPGSALARAAENLATHPIHVDHVADAIVRSIAEGVEGVVDVPTMRRWAGFEVPEQVGQAQHEHA
jgi:nucleoside-diphosphate-sugar epimerase